MAAELTSDIIERCVWAYYDSLRSHMLQYGPIADAFPDYVKGHKRLVATLGTDGGVLVHYPSEQDSFEFHVADKPVGELAAEYNLQITGIENRGMFPKLMFSGLTLRSGGLDGEIAWRAPWDTVEVWWGFKPRDWDETVAQASGLLATVVAISGAVNVH